MAAGSRASSRDERRPSRIAGTRLLQCLRRTSQVDASGRSQDQPIAPRTDRQLVRIVRPNGEAALDGIEPELEHAARQRLPIAFAENRDEHLAAETRVLDTPVYVEPGRIPAVRPPAQHVEPIAIAVAADPHVVGDDIEDEPQAMPAKGGRHRAEPRLTAEFRIQPRRVDDIVAMTAAGPRGEDRGCVDVADPQGREIGRQTGGFAKPEGRSELQPVGGPDRHPAAGGNQWVKCRAPSAVARGNRPMRKTFPPLRERASAHRVGRCPQ